MSTPSKIRIEDLTESNIDDLIRVCSSKRLSDPVHAEGVKVKKLWLLEMLRKFEPVSKIAYLNDEPVAQILYCPENSNPASFNRRKGVLNILCIYNPTPATQKLGVGTKLLQSVIDDAKRGKTCLGKEKCAFILAKAFNTGELLPLSEFYRKNGFLNTESDDSLYLPVEGNYERGKRVGEYEPLVEDKNRAVIFFSPQCQFSYQFAVKISDIIKEAAPKISIEIINEAERPDEFVKRKGCALVVNGSPIRTFFMESEKFREEIRQALHKKL